MEADWIAAFSSLISTMVAVALFSKAREEIHAWRDQRRTEKQAEIAAQLLAAFLRYVDGLKSLTEVFDDLPSKDAAPLWQQDWETFEQTDGKAWRAAAELAMIYLEDDVLQFIVEVDRARNDLSGKQWPRLLTGKSFRNYDELGFGERPQKAFEALRARGLALLKPLVQLRPSASVFGSSR